MSAARVAHLGAVALVVALAAAVAPAVMAGGAPPTGVYLDVSTVPAGLVADGATAPALYVEALSADGVPIAAPSPLPLSLTSSSPATVSVAATATIPAGAAAVVIPLTTTDQAGTAVINVSAPGAVAGSTPVKTVAPATATGLAFSVQLAPSTLYAGNSRAAYLHVALETSGTPVEPATASQPLTVRLVSSAPKVIGVPAAVTIPAGQGALQVPVRVGAPGPATVTALAQGVASGTASAAVMAAATGRQTGLALTVESEPATLVAGHGAVLVVQAENAAGTPVPLPCRVVQMASSNPAAIAVPSRATTACGVATQSLRVPMRAVGAGTATVTVAAPGVASTSTALTAVAAPPSTVRLDAAVEPPAAPAPGPVGGWVAVSLVGSAGAPDPTFVALPVTVRTSAGATYTATIPAGAGTTAVPVPAAALAAGQMLAVSAPGMAAEVLVIPRPAAAPPAPTWQIGPARLPLRDWAGVLWLVAIGLGLLLFAGGRRTGPVPADVSALPPSAPPALGPGAAPVARQDGEPGAAAPADANQRALATD